MDSAIWFNVDAHGKLCDAFILINIYSIPLVIRVVEATLNLWRLHIFFSFHAQDKLDSAKKAILFHFKALQLDLLLLKPLEISSGPLEVFALGWEEFEFSNAEKGPILAEETEALKQFTMIIPVEFTILW